MVIQLTTSAGYKPVGAHSRVPLNRTGTAYSTSKNNVQAKGAETALKASLERARLNNEYWEKLLEKLRKSGGGGGDSKSFDRITVSMMLSNFLSKKAALNLFRNFTSERSDLNNLPQFIDTGKQISFDNVVKVIGKLASPFIFSAGLLLKIPVVISQRITAQIISLLGILSFQLNKLKEVLEEDLKESVKKLDVREKIKTAKSELLDFFIEIKEWLLNSVRLVLSKDFSNSGLHMFEKM